MNACQEMEGLLAERASGDMAAEDAARLDAHLAECDRCRVELRAYQETFELAQPAIPEPHVGALDVTTFTAYQRRRRRRITGWTVGAGFVAAAVAASVVLAPALLTLRSLPKQQPAVVATTGTYDAVPVSGTDDQLTSGEVTGSDGQQYAAIDPADAALAAFDEADTL